MAQQQSQLQDQISKAVSLATTFLSGCVAINVSQVLGAPISLINEDWYNSWISHTKKSFALLTMTMTERWAPTVVKVSGDKSMRGQLFRSSQGELLCNFPRRLVMMANHQIYTDWLYLWWIAYTNGMHGRIYIILKESLKRIPVIGWGMQLCQFIFLKRNWEADKPNMASHLKKLNNLEDPMWLLLFPEGTNLAPSTRQASKRWAEKNGIKDLKHTLLPRATGLKFCLEELEETLGYVYDCTIAYEGVPRGQYAQDIYTLQASYVEGKPPKCVNMYWRRFPLKSIPIHNERAFELWLRARWMEKDSLLDYYHQCSHFPADTGSEKGPSGRIRRGAGYITTTIKANRWHEFLMAFMPMGLLALILYSFYGSLPEALMKNIPNQPVTESFKQLREAKVPEAQRKAAVRAASEATGVRSINVHNTGSNSVVGHQAKPIAQSSVKTGIGKQNKPSPPKASLQEKPGQKLRPPSSHTGQGGKTTAGKKILKLGPRSQRASSAVHSTAASTNGSIPKLGPRKTTDSIASGRPSRVSTASSLQEKKPIPKLSTGSSVTRSQKSVTKLPPRV